MSFHLATVNPALTYVRSLAGKGIMGVVHWPNGMWMPLPINNPLPGRPVVDSVIQVVAVFHAVANAGTPDTQTEVVVTRVLDPAVLTSDTLQLVAPNDLTVIINVETQDRNQCRLFVMPPTTLRGGNSVRVRDSRGIVAELRACDTGACSYVQIPNAPRTAVAEGPLAVPQWLRTKLPDRLVVTQRTMLGMPEATPVIEALMPR